jgi:predicted O-linked N-acetylglucosamine transferase (SPINDLY family)
VGYVSGDFRATPVAWFIAPVLRHHDPERIETYCYSNAPAEDEITARLRPEADHWRRIHDLDDDAVVALVQRDGIDVLVDLSGHTLANRLGVFARRAAPVQATWLGYLNTTGLASMDYRITDAHTDPVGRSEALHSERLARMPHSQWCWVPFHDAQAKVVEEPVAGAAPVFASFNHTGKISDASVELWSAILRRVPRAKLRVHAAGRADQEEILRARFSAHGVDASRLSFVPDLPIDGYFDAFRGVDIALDTFPYNGGTTTFVTYWMGVPMVALTGQRGIARGGYSIARSAGFDELIARNAQEYVELNVALAEDAPRRVALARTLRDRLMASVLGDAERFTRDLEALYHDMVARKA